MLYGCCGQRQLGEAKQEVERERTKLSCTIEQLTTAQEHVAHLKEEVRIFARYFYHVHIVVMIPLVIAVVAVFVL